MKQIKVFSIMLLFATMFVSFNACSSDDDDKKEENNLIVGKWKELGSTKILEFKSNGTFQYTETDDASYEEHGKWRIEANDKLYFLFSDENEWLASKIHELNSISLILEEYDEKGNLDGYKESYQRIN